MAQHRLWPSPQQGSPQLRFPPYVTGKGCVNPTLNPLPVREPHPVAHLFSAKSEFDALRARNDTTLVGDEL